MDKESRSADGFVLKRSNTASESLWKIKPDVVVSFLTEIYIVSAIPARLEGIPIIISERTHLAFHSIGYSQALGSELINH